MSTVGERDALERVLVRPARPSAPCRRRPRRSRTRSTVMLSSPPPRFAAETSAFVARSRSSRCFSTTSRMSSSSTMSVSPSEQSRKTSPSPASTVNASTSTSGSVPTARVITERCGCVSASSRRELAALQQLVDERVVLGQLLELAAADDVGARVADVADRHARRRRRARRSSSSPCPTSRDRCSRARRRGGSPPGSARRRAPRRRTRRRLGRPRAPRRRASRRPRPPARRPCRRRPRRAAARRRTSPRSAAASCPCRSPARTTATLIPRTSARSRRRARCRRSRACAAGRCGCRSRTCRSSSRGRCTHTPSRRGSMRTWRADANSSASIITSFCAAAADRERRGVELVLVARLEDRRSVMTTSRPGCAAWPIAPPASAGRRMKLSCGSRRSVAAVRTMRQMKR